VQADAAYSFPRPGLEQQFANSWSGKSASVNYRLAIHQRERTGWAEASVSA